MMGDTRLFDAIKRRRQPGVVQAHQTAAIYYLLVLRLEYLFKSAINLAAVGGGLTFPSTTSWFDIGLPYMSLFASSSGRSVAP